MPVKKKETLLPAPSREDLAFKRALQEGEARRLEYVKTLHPRERENLDPC
jgi:hypothetical protein